MRTTALVTGILLTASYLGGLFFGIEYFFEDRLFSPREISDELIIVAIDDVSLREIGQWPWPRKVFADALKKLEAYTPRVVALDVIFADPSRLGRQDDSFLSGVIAHITYPLVMPLEGRNLIFKGNEIPISESVIRTLPEFLSGDTVREGHVNLLTEKDGIVRRIPLSLMHDGMTTSSFAAEAAGMTGRKDIARIVYAGPQGTVPAISFSDLFKGVDLPILKGKRIFIGATAIDLHDEQATPFSEGSKTSGVEIQAQSANMLIRGYSLDPIARTSMVFLLLLAAMIPALVFSMLEGRLLLALSANFLIGIMWIASAIIAFDRGVALNFVHINMAWVLGTASSFSHQYFVTDKDRRQIKRIFSKYVSRDVLEELLRDPSKVRLGGEERHVTVFFSDVRSFTTLSEGMSPAELTQFLNIYLSRMTDIVLTHRGVVDKYIGDAIMAFWGAPLPNEHHALSATQASLRMLEALDDLNEEFEKSGKPKISIGIGLNTGDVTVGNMGSEQRFDYTVMGDTVNLASRLESQTKTYGVRILISEATKNAIELSREGDDFIYMREIDKIKVKGKKLPVTVYEVVEEKRRLFIQKIEGFFDEAREHYYAGRFSECLRLLEKIITEGEDGPTRVLYERATHFVEEPPADWQGVYEMKTK